MFNKHRKIKAQIKVGRVAEKHGGPVQAEPVQAWFSSHVHLGQTDPGTAEMPKGRVRLGAEDDWSLCWQGQGSVDLWIGGSTDRWVGGSAAPASPFPPASALMPAWWLMMNFHSTTLPHQPVNTEIIRKAEPFRKQLTSSNSRYR